MSNKNKKSKRKKITKRQQANARKKNKQKKHLAKVKGGDTKQQPRQKKIAHGIVEKIQASANPVSSLGTSSPIQKRSIRSRFIFGTKEKSY